MLKSSSLFTATATSSSALRLVTARRFLNLHEYQSKALMAQHQISTQDFIIAKTPSEAEAAFRTMNVPEIVLKAQIHAGGRGKGHFTSGLKGGVHLVKDAKRTRQLAEQMLGQRLVTKQTTSKGALVHTLMIAEALKIKRETYFAILMDRASPTGVVMVGSPDGGVDIEAVAAKTPERIFREDVDILTGPTKEQTERLAKNCGFTGNALAQASQQFQNLYKLFIAVDATQVEINPLGETDTGRVLCFDAKINFDDNAEFRQKSIFAETDKSEEDEREVRAQQFNLNYIGMDGNIGCLVNGAGLAMATMDIIKLYGGEPANFLDIGGSASENQVKEAFKIITSDPHVKAILVNIFGGIMRCDTIALGIVAAVKEIGLKLPLVVRLSGTNVEQGKKILRESGLPILAADDLDHAAQKAVQAISKKK